MTAASEGRRQILPTTVVGSYPQPDWLVDRKVLGSRLPPRTRALEIWKVAADVLEQAQDDATVVAIREMERAGIDIITDGEIRRESYSNRFATALEGIDTAKPGQVKARSGQQTPVPRALYAHFGLDADRFDTFMVLQDGRAYVRWAGLLAAARTMPAPWCWLGSLGRVVPGVIGDPIYDWVQRNRLRWFGSRAVCFVPEPKSKARIV